MNNSTCSSARHLWGAGLLVIGLTLSIPCQAQPKYNVSNLGTLGGPWWTSAAGINSSGQVAGSSTVGAGYAHAFRTASNTAINPPADDLGTLGGLYSQAFGINTSGQVAGISYNSYGGLRSFRTTPNGTINPVTDDLGSAWARAINSKGQVAGFDFNSHAACSQPPTRARHEIMPSWPIVRPSSYPYNVAPCG